MAVRGSSSRRIIDNPLGGILREIDRSKRTVTGPTSGGTQGSWSGQVATQSGTVTVTFPRAFGDVPVVVATSVTTPLVCTVLSATSAGVTVRAFTLDGAIAGDGILLNITANERT